VQGIYEIRNTVNGAVYIGQSVDTKNRMQSHRNALEGDKHYNGMLQQDWNTYGREAFIFKHVETVYKGSRLLIREQDIIDSYEEVGAIIYNSVGRSTRKRPLKKTILWRRRTK